MKDFTILEVADFLIGDIGVYGETNSDERSLENLKNVDQLIYHYLSKLLFIADYENDHRASVQALGKKSKQILKYIKQLLGEDL